MKSSPGADFDRIYEILDKAYPRTKPYLEYSNAYQLLISVILSAQTTDGQVNRVTPELFSRYPEPVDLGNADIEEVERIIRQTGFYHTKARNIVATAAALSRDFGSQVPREMDDLTSLPGVGRKSANVVRGIAFGLPAVIVDTHFSRVTRRLGLVSARDPEKIEREIGTIVEPDKRTRFSMTVNSHGRACCFARKPACARCPIRDYCPARDPSS